MQEFDFNNISQFINQWDRNDKYFNMLRLMASLSHLFSESEIPYLDYRLTENLFCRYFNATNEARSCTAYDARFENIGIGIKTFILSKNNHSVEKIAEFNKLKKTLNDCKGKDLAIKLGMYRNDRIQFANNQYNVTESIYHIIGRKEGLLRIFNTPYEEIDISRIHLDKDDDTSCAFHDEKNEYIFNKSKSVLTKRFIVPKNFKDVKVDILEEPLELLEKLFSDNKEHTNYRNKKTKGTDFIILPLYAVKGNKKYVAEKSGLNQFNAGGRARNPLEVYIPVPAIIHKKYPQFFPDSNTPFDLILPNGNTISAKICQQGGKALMSNPNSALGDWLLKKVLNKKDYDPVTMDDLNRFGFDSVCIENTHTVDTTDRPVYKIFFSDTENSFDEFI